MQASIGISPPRPDEPRVRFLVELARALGTYGTSSNRLEEVTAVCAAELGLRAQTFSTPTSVFVSVESDDNLATYLARVTPGEVNINKLMQIDRLFNLVIAEKLTPQEGIAQIKEVVNESPLYPMWLTVLCYGLVSGCVGAFLGGGFQEMIASGAIGLVIGVLVHFTGSKRELSRLMEFLSGLSAALIAGLFSIPFVGYMPAISAIAGIIVLLPGLTLTVAMVELATKHVVSGSARLIGAIMVLLVIGFGVVIGQGLSGVFVEQPEFFASHTLGWMVEVPALLVATLGAAVLFQAKFQYAWAMVLAGFLSFYSARYGTQYLGLEAGALFAAMALGCACNLYARIFDRPAVTMMMPGLLMLVPGSLGLKSLQLFLKNETVDGVQSTVTVLIIGVALVVGLLLSNVILPPRKVL